MRNKGSDFIILFVLVFFALIGFNCVLNKIDSYIIREGYVESIDNNTLTIVDTTGTVWIWKEKKEGQFNKWDNVKLVMDNHNTLNTIEDDIILKIKLDK